MEHNEATRRARDWFDSKRERGVFHDRLQALAEGVTGAAGFGVAAISVLRVTDEFEVVAVAGDEDAQATLLGHFTPRQVVDAELEVAEHWGTLRYVSHRVATQSEHPGWIPDYEPDASPDAWHPQDLLMAPLRDGSDRLIGLMSVDLPEGNRRPGPAQLARLEEYAAQAGRTLAEALHDSDLLEEVRLAAAARAIVRRASSHLTIYDVLAECGPGLLESFWANGVWLQSFEDGKAGQTLAMMPDDPDVVLPSWLIEMGLAAAQQMRGEVSASILSARRGIDGGLTADERVLALDHLATLGISSLLFVPLGAGAELLGCLALTRGLEAPEWSDTEILMAQDIGLDLGRALFNARLFEREQQVTRELRELAAYRTQLLNTLAHELRTPLTSIIGHAELVEDLTAADSPTIGSVRAVQRGADRLEQLVDELLTLARVSDPEAITENTVVDLVEVVGSVMEMLSLQAETRGVRLRRLVPGEPAPVRGSAGDFERILVNLLGNAIKYSPAGTTVTVALEQAAGEVVLTVADQGYGISEEEQVSLFREFFRSADPRARTQPGTGLGLAIVHRTVQRYGGTIAVDSTPDLGSTFTVTLPAG